MIVLQAWNLDWLNKQDYLKEVYLLLYPNICEYPNIRSPKMSNIRIRSSKKAWRMRTIVVIPSSLTQFSGPVLTWNWYVLYRICVIAILYMGMTPGTLSLIITSQWSQFWQVDIIPADNVQGLSWLVQQISRDWITFSHWPIFTLSAGIGICHEWLQLSCDDKLKSPFPFKFLNV